MSILLDSLRKSEAQRTHREPPTIHSTRSFDAVGEQQRSWLAMAMIAVAALAIGWFGLQQFSAPGEDLASAQDQPELAEQQVAAPPGDEKPASTGAGQETDRTPVERFTQAASEQAPGVDDGDARAAESQTPVDRIARFSAEEDATAQQADMAQETASAASVAEAIEAVEPADAPAEFEAAAVEESLARVEPRTAQQNRREAPPADQPRSYWQLPQSWRSEMPEFKISVLVYADAPEDRFIYINGERKKEGEQIDSGVALEEIRRDGAVFIYRGQRFLVKS